MPEPMSEVSEQERLVLELGRALHRYGVPTHRLEETLQAIARLFDIEAGFFSLPTAILAFFGPLGRQRVGALRLEPGVVDLGKLVRLDDAVHRIFDGHLTPQAGLELVRSVENEAPRYGGWAVAAALACASGAAARLFGGGLPEMGASFGVGLLLAGLLAVLGERGRDLVVPLSATLAATVAQLGTHVMPYKPEIVTISGLLLFLPGLILTTATTELATRNFISGSSRLTLAALIFLQLVFGVALGSALANMWPVSEPLLPAPLNGLPSWTELAAIGTAGLCFVVLYQARPQDAGVILVAALVAMFGSRLGARLLSPELGAWVGALAVGVLANGYSRWLNRPSAVLVVPGILLLVPGSMGLQSLTFMLENETLAGASAIFRTMLIAVALATGVLTANYVVSPRHGL